MPARSPAKTAAPNAPGGSRKGTRRFRISLTEPITEAQIAEIARHIPQGATRPFVPLALEALIKIIKTGDDPNARRDAAEVLTDFYETPLGKTFAPQGSIEATRTERLGEVKAN